MVKKRSESSVRGIRHAKNAKRIPDSEIDFSDIPESTDEQLSKAQRVGRPKSQNPKQMIALRIDPKLLSKLRKMANKKSKPYQTLLHELLEKAVKKAA